MSVKPIPEGYHTVTVHLVCRDAATAIDFYRRAFDAEELERMEGPGGKIAHAEIKIGDSRVMLADEFPEMGAHAPASLGGSPVSMLIYSTDVDAAYKKALGAGATSKQEPTDMFWGDRYCKLEDPFGHQWSVATHIEDLTPEQMRERAQKAMGG